MCSLFFSTTVIPCWVIAVFCAMVLQWTHLLKFVSRNDDTEVFHHKSHMLFNWNWQGMCFRAIWQTAWFQNRVLMNSSCYMFLRHCFAFWIAVNIPGCLATGHEVGSGVFILQRIFMISGLCCGVNESFTDFGCYAAYIGSYRRFGTT
jgi:hypothetical protein